MRRPHNLKSRGITAIEYAVLVAVIAAALVGMSAYLKRSLGGKWRSVGDSFGQGRQYAPDITTGVLPPPPTTLTHKQELENNLNAILAHMSNIFGQAYEYNTTTGQFGSIAGLKLISGEQVYYRRGLMGAARNLLFYQVGVAGPMTQIADHLLTRASSVDDPGVKIVSNGNQHTITMTMRWDPASPASADNPEVTKTIVVYSQ
jgi:Flp pilus assembly pilin Flp